MNNKPYGHITTGGAMIPEQLEGYDWQAAFEYAGPLEEGEDKYGHGYGNSAPTVGVVPGATVAATSFQRRDVATIAHIKEGENDGDDWIVAGQLTDGRWFMLRAGCDYTGWDCQAGGSADVADNYEDLVKLGMTDDERRRFGIEL